MYIHKGYGDFKILIAYTVKCSFVSFLSDELQCMDIHCIYVGCVCLVNQLYITTDTILKMTLYKCCC